ncbi:hypothetical protein EZV62_008251 [Acer yangbiense]|uniref:Uncharacterized protein n=1 Tax=Acer yangbiense TaxID=1000413 RepID=A0A5C7IEY0_9ROSI|nr:hypothetical protein EZV62_008251 [Acer yangbiense]
MQFDIRVRRNLGNISWGYATPITVGYRFYQQSMFPIALSSGSSINPNNSKASAYKIGIRLFDKISLSDIISTSSERVEITAEGIYGAETGQLFPSFEVKDKWRIYQGKNHKHTIKT